MIICCGEALIDMLPQASQTGSTCYEPNTGGAVFNTSIALGRLGVETAMFTGLSNDLFGEMLAADLRHSGVDISQCVRSDRPTTLAFVNLVNGQASYSFYDENTAGRLLSKTDVPDIFHNAKAFFFGGISLAVEPCAEAYAAIAAREAGRTFIMVDPNIRQAFIKDEKKYRNRILGIIEASTVIKVSDEDLAWLVKDGESIQDKISALSGPALRIVTEGSKGATAFLSSGKQVTIASQKVKVVDTVGAGDTFNAGILSYLSSYDLLDSDAIASMTREDATTMLEHAHKIAAVTVSRTGANPPWVHEL